MQLDGILYLLLATLRLLPYMWRQQHSSSSSWS